MTTVQSPTHASTVPDSIFPGLLTPLFSSRLFRFFSQKPGDPHPPTPVTAAFCSKFSCKSNIINSLNFSNVNELVTVNPAFCLTFGLKRGCFEAKSAISSSS
jgi:hypothetical protein